MFFSLSKALFIHLRDNLVLKRFCILQSNSGYSCRFCCTGPTGSSQFLFTVKVQWTYKQKQRNCDFCCICKQQNHYTLTVAVKVWVSAFRFVKWDIHVSKEDLLATLLLHWRPVIFNHYLSSEVLNPSKQVSMGNILKRQCVYFSVCHLHLITIYSIWSW